MVTRPVDGLAVDLEPLMTATRTINAVIVRSLAAVDETLTVPQLRVLVILARRGTANLAAVATDLGVNPSNASRTCDQLVRHELVVREVDREDRRRVVLALSSAGTTVLAQVMDRRRDLLAAVVAAMPRAEQRRLVQAMAAFNAATESLGDAGLEAAPTTVPPWPT